MLEGRRSALPIVRRPSSINDECGTRRDSRTRIGKRKRNGRDGTGRECRTEVGGSDPEDREWIDRSIDGGDEKRAIHDAGRSGANQLVADVSTK